ncbi:uncharacterized protein LOC143539848 [Bidens hawaiensis]|uniref:uncharacterized protein LOC143539848 n=1 Tax=Bidens hawaiensis TaxID=980011 RepID=UPI00404A9955
MESSLGFFGVIRESFKTTSRNIKLLVPILVLVFLLFSQIDFAQEYTLTPISNDFMFQLATHPNIVHDLWYNIGETSYIGIFDTLRDVILVKLLIVAISSIVTLVFLVATVSSSYEAYTAKVLGLEDMLLKIRKSWKRPILTSFYLFFLSLGITLFYVLVITSLLAVNSWLLLFFGVIAPSILVCYFYVATLWMVSLIVSVLEEGSGGLKAIGRATELMKGKRLQASLMMVLFVVADDIVILVAKVVTSCVWSFRTKLAIMILLTNGFCCLLRLFMFVVYTVFYHEWKTSHDEKEGNDFYLPIADMVKHSTCYTY